MAEHRPEVADVLREHGAAYLARHGASADQRRVLRDLARCRTAALGGHCRRCDQCGHEQIAYNSCRNRHCPKCQGPARAAWLSAREGELLEVPYFHVVFTLPAEIGPLALQNRRLVYDLLFQAVARTLLTIARDPQHLGAQLGFLCVLHTWGQNLHHHPHLHGVVPGGGLARDQQHWVPARRRFLLPVRVLQRFYRECFLRGLAQAHQQNQLTFHGELTALAQPPAWQAWLASLRRHPWVVYAKPPFGGPQQVLRYLARYTHRVAIANSRLLSTSDGKVRFLWKDYRHGHQQREMTLEADEFIRRFLLHVMPKGFQHIRQYGFLANRAKRDKLALCRRLLAAGAHQRRQVSDPKLADHSVVRTGDWRCPHCRSGRLHIVAVIIAPPPPPRAPPATATSVNQGRTA